MKGNRRILRWIVDGCSLISSEEDKTKKSFNLLEVIDKLLIPNEFSVARSFRENYTTNIVSKRSVQQKASPRLCGFTLVCINAK